MLSGCYKDVLYYLQGVVASAEASIARADVDMTKYGIQDSFI